MWRPSRNTEIRSAMANTSSRRWLMNRTATPSSRSWRTCRNRRSTSWADSAAVGSSMISTRTSSEMALAISMACWAATGSPTAGMRGSRCTSRRDSRASASAHIFRQSHDTAQVAVADEDVLGHAQIGEDQRLLVDGGDAEPLGVGGVAGRHGRAVDQDLALVRRVDAGHHLDQRRLAGPVLAHQRVDLAPPQLERHVVEGTRGPEALGDAPHGEHDILGSDHHTPRRGYVRLCCI